MPESPQVQVGEGSTSRNASTGNTYKVQGVGTLLARGWKSPVRSVLVPQPLCVPTTTAAETAGQQAAGGSFPADFLGIQAGLESPAGLLLCPDEGTFPVREGSLTYCILATNAFVVPSPPRDTKNGSFSETR